MSTMTDETFWLGVGLTVSILILVAVLVVLWWRRSLWHRWPDTDHEHK